MNSFTSSLEGILGGILDDGMFVVSIYTLMTKRQLLSEFCTYSDANISWMNVCLMVPLVCIHHNCMRENMSSIVSGPNNNAGCRLLW